MNYEKIISFLVNTTNKPSNLKQKFRLKEMITYLELVTKIVKINSKLQG